MIAGPGSSCHSPSLLLVRFNAVQLLLGFYLNNVPQVFRFWLQAHITSNKHIVFIACWSCVSYASWQKWLLTVVGYNNAPVYPPDQINFTTISCIFPEKYLLLR